MNSDFPKPATPSFQVHHSFDVPVPRYNHILSYWGSKGLRDPSCELKELQWTSRTIVGVKREIIIATGYLGRGDGNREAKRKI